MGRGITWILVLSLLCSVVLSNEWESKFHPRLSQLFQSTEDHEQLSFFVLLDNLDKPAPIPSNLTPIEREKQQTQYIWDLMHHAESTQSSVLAILQEFGVIVEKSFWLSNFIQVRANHVTAKLVSDLPFVRGLEPNEHAQRISTVVDGFGSNHTVGV